MRWPIIRLIWLRELRDQLRDRRTLFMMAGLPLLLYPVLGLAVLQFAVGFVQKPSTIGIVAGPFRSREFPARAPAALPACLARAPLVVRTRKGDDASTQASRRLDLVLEHWKRNVNAIQLTRQGLPPDFDEPFTVHDPVTTQAAAGGGAGAAAMLKLMVRIFPFM